MFSAPFNKRKKKENKNNRNLSTLPLTKFEFEHNILNHCLLCTIIKHVYFWINGKLTIVLWMEKSFWCNKKKENWWIKYFQYVAPMSENTCMGILHHGTLLIWNYGTSTHWVESHIANVSFDATNSKLGSDNKKLSVTKVYINMSTINSDKSICVCVCISLFYFSCYYL